MPLLQAEMSAKSVTWSYVSSSSPESSPVRLVRSNTALAGTMNMPCVGRGTLRYARSMAFAPFLLLSARYVTHAG